MFHSRLLGNFLTGERTAGFGIAPNPAARSDFLVQKGLPIRFLRAGPTA